MGRAEFAVLVFIGALVVGYLLGGVWLPFLGLVGLALMGWIAER